jgi:hypothetical protein
MRENGIPDFADPQPNEGGAQILLPDGVTPEKAKEVGEKCKQYLPSGDNVNPNAAEDPQATERMKKFAECMRTNGLPAFPDPEPGGGLKLSDVDQNDPKYRSAQQACSQYLGGAGPKAGARPTG